MSDTLTSIECIKKALFGYQQQADSVNNAIANIVYYYLTKVNPNSSIQFVDDAVTQIENALIQLQSKDAGSITTDDVYFIKLVTGIKSYYNLVSGEPVVIRVKQSNPESPKRRFSINIFGTEADTADTEVSTSLTSPISEKTTDSLPDSVKDKSFWLKRADAAYEKVCHCIPQTLQQSGLDKYTQALVVMTYLEQER